MKISKNKLNNIIKEEMEKVELINSIFAAIDSADPEDLVKLAALMDADESELDEALGTLGAIGLGVAGSTTALAIWDMIKAFKDESDESDDPFRLSAKNTPTPHRDAFAADLDLQKIRAYIEKNVNKAERGR